MATDQATAPSESAPAEAPKTAQTETPAPKHASEEARFEQPVEPPDFEIPEKFLKDGKPDFKALADSYHELEKNWNTKNEELLEKAKADMFKERPEAADKYTPPEIENWNKEEMLGHPLYQWFREEAFNRGYSDEQFQEAIKTYAERSQPNINKQEEIAKLGDNAKARIASVAKWMQKFEDDPKTYNMLDQLAFTADGIETLEKLMGQDGFEMPDQAAPPAPKITAEQLREWQADPRYWDATRRDPDFVKKVDDGYRDLYEK